MESEAIDHIDFLLIWDFNNQFPALDFYSILPKRGGSSLISILPYTAS